MLTYDTLANPRLSQKSASSKPFWLTKFWVPKIEFPAHQKKEVKKNKKHQSVISKRFDLMFQGKSCHGLSQAQRDTATHQGLSNIKGLISELIRVKVKNTLETINN